MRLLFYVIIYLLRLGAGRGDAMFKWPGASMTYLHLRQHQSVHGAGRMCAGV